MDADHLATYIRAHQIAAEIVHLDVPTPTVESAAQAVGVMPDQIVKSVLFMVREPDGRTTPILVIGNGVRHVDQGKVARHLGLAKKRVRLANATQVATHTGYSVGTVPPFGHPQPIATLVESRVMRQQAIYAGGGAINALVRITVAELQRVLQAEIVDLAGSA